MEVGILCLICGEIIPLTESEVEYVKVKVCDKCKQAVLWTRKEMEKKKDGK